MFTRMGLKRIVASVIAQFNPVAAGVGSAPVDRVNPKYRADQMMAPGNRLSQKGRRKRARWNNHSK